MFLSSSVVQDETDMGTYVDFYKRLDNGPQIEKIEEEFDSNS